MEIRPYTAEWESAVKAFNQRLKQGGIYFRFPEVCQSPWLPRAGEDPLYEEYFLVTEGEAVRGGYILKHQLFSLNGKTTPVGYLYLPLSEGLIDKRYSKVGLLVLTNALKRQPLLYCLGMGSFYNPLPMLLQAAGWKLCSVPFFFTIVHPAAFLKNIVHLRRRTLIRLAFDFADATGLGDLAVKALNYFRQKAARSMSGVEVELVPEFGSWADELWQAGPGPCALIAIRDQAALNRLYPARKEKFLKLKITQAGRTIGWAVALDSQLAKHKHFGELRLGSIIDCFATPGSEFAVTCAAMKFLQERGVDLIISNQAHRDWRTAYERCGFLSSASNYIFAASVKLSAQLSPFETQQALLHFCRGDGEGPTHLS